MAGEAEGHQIGIRVFANEELREIATQLARLQQRVASWTEKIEQMRQDMLQMVGNMEKSDRKIERIQKKHTSLVAKFEQMSAALQEKDALIAVLKSQLAKRKVDSGGGDADDEPLDKKLKVEAGADEEQ